ncbi:MAG: RimK/LysX family protein [Planctomycetes bacterium]|nr:RimK/LysX family protein [Planctomycetota bacterium]
MAVWIALSAWGESVFANSKHIIGATATITETESGLSFPARIDTGAQSCSLHVEKIEIKGESNSRVRNVGKRARILLKDAKGKTEWIEATIAKAVRVKSSSLKSGEYDHRYKVRLTLRWKDFRKQVLVTLNDRTDMEFPLLIGRNFLRGDFLVDVAKKD